MAFIGVDLHTNTFTTCRRELDGSEKFETYKLCPADLDKFCHTLSADDEIAVEATGNSTYFRNEVISCVSRVVVVNSSQFHVIRRSVKKTDKNDARALALFLSKDMLPETRVKSRQHTELASVTQTRDMMVKQRTRFLNKIHGLYNAHGIKIKKEKFASIRALTKMDMSVFTDVEKIEVTIIRDMAITLSHSIKEIDGHIESIASELEGYEGLTSIKGVGSRAAAIFLSAIGDVEDFATPDKLAAYVGIVPKVSQSNETDNRGRITKRGSKLVRTTLVQCSLSAIRYSGYLNAFYQRIKAKRGAGKAIIATARKLLTIIYNTLRNGWVFEDFTTFTKRETPFPAGQSS
jgi:transposase